MLSGIRPPNRPLVDQKSCHLSAEEANRYKKLMAQARIAEGLDYVTARELKGVNYE